MKEESKTPRLFDRLFGRGPKSSVASILIVEDDAHIAKGIKLNLEAEGYAAAIAPDGPTALATIETDETAIDLMILDVMMPGMSGYAVCETLRRQGWHRPIVILSARTLTEDRIRGFDAGADVYLQKPFDLEELLSVVRRSLANARHRRSEPPTTPTKPIGAAYRFGDAEVNFETFEVRVAGRDAKLTALEIKLLRYFVEHEGIVVSRAKLLEDVWGLNHIPTTRTVDNFVLNLRKTFERDPANPRHFLGVRGAGYRFVADVARDTVKPEETPDATLDEEPAS
ncbi:MAG: response regulator transcription factor [Pirellulales bacterium]